MYILNRFDLYSGRVARKPVTMPSLRQAERTKLLIAISEAENQGFSATKKALISLLRDLECNLPKA